jgi:hypothetical protein
MNLTGIPFLATAISIIICWALFAILCSIIHESIAQITSERGRFMKQYLLLQLNDQQNGINWGTLLYMHGSVALFSRAPGKPSSDIPAKVFAETLVEIVAGAELVQQKKKEQEIKGEYKSRLLNNFKAATIVLVPTELVAFLSQSLDTAELIAGSNESKIYQALTDNIESWYSAFTGRLSLWYKKKTRQRLFIIGILLAVIFNIDSIQLFRYFENQPNARAALMNYYQKNAASLSNESDTTLSLVKAISYTQQFDSLSKAAALPIGWPQQLKPAGEEAHSLLLLILLKIAGFLITGLTASSGAPFWFDLLKKAVSKKT